jgi:hypothetical protein
LKEDLECWIEMPGIYLEFREEDKQFRSGHFSNYGGEGRCFYEERILVEFTGPFYKIIHLSKEKSKKFYFWLNDKDKIGITEHLRDFDCQLHPDK